MRTEDRTRRSVSEEPGGPDLTGKEKQDYVEQVEEFEGPDRREKRGSDEETAREPGVARS
ncbi:MAG TPA: hypothetical protein VFS34_04310 [Thermoanaerobaculia bacterium]|nr:hypothetical protein [Thermoanaerobaculia bacterium]